MILVGIDVASEKHDVAIMDDSDTTKVHARLRIENSSAGYKKLLGAIEAAKELFPNEGLRIGLESTGVYSVGLTEYLARIYGGSVILINPVLTSMFELSIRVHYAKTDANDAVGICKFLARNQDIRPYAPVSYHTRRLRSLYRERSKLCKRLLQDTCRLKGMLHVAFPEILGLGCGRIGQFELEFLKRYPTAESLKGKRPESLAKALSKVKYLRFGLDKAKEIVSLAKDGISCDSMFDGLMIRSAVERIELLRRQIGEIDDMMDSIVREEHPNILTFPGMGSITVGAFIGEVGDVSNYHGSDGIVALAGLNPIVYESGKYKADRTRISKKGSHYLRNALYLAADSMYMRKQEPIYGYVKKKLSEGKSHRCAIDHAARKLINIMYSMMKNDTVYEEKNNKK